MIFGVLLSVLALGTLVAGDAGLSIIMENVKVTNNPNDYFGEMQVDLIQEKRDTTKLTTKMPVKTELPEGMMIKIIVQMEGQDPVEFESSLCEAMEDEALGKTFVDAGTPDDFPKKCPFLAGDWTVLEWRPPAESVPSVPDGPISGTMSFYEEGQDPYVVIEYQGELLHPPPEY